MQQLTLFRLAALALLPGLIIIGGSAGYVLVEDWAWHDAVYMTVITLSTVGFGEVEELSRHGRIFTSLLILVGVGAFAFVATVIAQAIIEGHVTGVWQRRRIERKLRHMRDHYIVCGYGRVAATLIQRLQRHEHVVVVIDSDVSVREELEGKNLHFLQGDAVREATLHAASIEGAAGISFCLPSDADNLFGMLSARSLNADIHITVRAENPHSEEKMRFAGADAVINPSSIAGYAMAMQLLQPNAVNVMDFLALSRSHGNSLETLSIEEGSRVVDRSLGELNLQQEFGLTVLQVLRKDNSIVLRAGPDTRLQSGDTLLVIGAQEGFTGLCATL